MINGRCRKEKCRKFCGKYVGFISFISNLFVALIKIVIGFIAHSQALVADGFHSCSDALSAIIMVITLKVSGKPPDKDHPYGHGKIEYIVASFFGLLLFTLAITIFYRASHSLITGSIVQPHFLALGPAIISIMVNVAISSYGMCVGREINSPIVIANAKENRADALSSVASLIGVTGSLLGYTYFDPIAALIVGLLISRMGYEILTDASKSMMDVNLSDEKRNKMKKTILAVSGVESISFLKAWYTGQKIWVDTRIRVPETITLDKADRIASDVRNALLRNYPDILDAVVYMDTKKEPERKTGFFEKIKKRVSGQG